MKVNELLEEKEVKGDRAKLQWKDDDTNSSL